MNAVNNMYLSKPQAIGLNNNNKSKPTSPGGEPVSTEKVSMTAGRNSCGILFYLSLCKKGKLETYMKCMAPKQYNLPLCLNSHTSLWHLSYKLHLVSFLLHTDGFPLSPTLLHSPFGVGSDAVAAWLRPAGFVLTCYGIPSRCNPGPFFPDPLRCRTCGRRASSVLPIIQLFCFSV
jgi:hypothetical protein